MQQSLRQTFNETAAAAQKEFPRELEKLVVLLVPSSDRPVYVSPAIAHTLTKSTADIKAAVDDLAEKMQAENWIGLANGNYNLAGTRINLIALDNQRVSYNLSQRYRLEMELIFTLDHEIGHHIVKSGFTSSFVSPQRAESAADAFAMLRHIQRFGKNTDHAGNCAERMASCIVLSADQEHYTSDAIQRVIRISEQRDISGLSLRETAALAEEIADECYIDNQRLENIREAYRSVAKSYGKGKRDAAVIHRKIISVMKRHRRNADIFNAGSRFLSVPYEKEFIINAARTDRYWRKALRFIENPKAKPPRRGILRFLGLRR